MIEHPLHTIERLWGFTKVRCRALAKRTVQEGALGMLANFFCARHRLGPQGT